MDLCSTHRIPEASGLRSICRPRRRWPPSGRLPWKCQRTKKEHLRSCEKESCLGEGAWALSPAGASRGPKELFIERGIHRLNSVARHRDEGDNEWAMNSDESVLDGFLAYSFFRERARGENCPWPFAFRRSKWKTFNRVPSLTCGDSRRAVCRHQRFGLPHRCEGGSRNSGSRSSGSESGLRTGPQSRMVEDSAEPFPFGSRRHR
jgi:hypothetical protein